MAGNTGSEVASRLARGSVGRMQSVVTCKLSNALHAETVKTL